MPFADVVKFDLPAINYSAIAPILIIGGAAILSVLFEAFLPRQARRPVQLVLVLASVVASLVVVISLAGTRLITANRLSVRSSLL